MGGAHCLFSNHQLCLGSLKVGFPVKGINALKAVSNKMERRRLADICLRASAVCSVRPFWRRAVAAPLGCMAFSGCINAIPAGFGVGGNIAGYAFAD